MMRMLTETFGNPSSGHEVGMAANRALALARSRVAKAVGCERDEIFFTPSGTCANNTAIFGAVRLMRRRGDRIITTSLEHPSVAEPLKYLESRGFEVLRLPVERDGKASLSALRAALSPKTVLVSMMLVNNETGVVNPVAEAAGLVRRSGCGAIFHCDAVQAFGKIPVKPSRLGVDLLTVSAHKIHGPKGAGALYVRKGLRLPPTIMGGGQEQGLFSGTEAMPAIAGFGAAAAAIPELTAQRERITALRNRFIEKISQDPHIAVNSPADALPYVINISVVGVPSEVTINSLSDSGIYISAGSACKKGGRSEVLKAIGLPPARIDSAVRISLSRYTTEEDMDRLCDKLFETAARVLR